MRKRWYKVVSIILLSAMLIPGCKEEDSNKEETKPIADVVEDERPTDGFAYEEKGAGIVLTEYYGSSEEVDIPSEIDGQIVIGLESNVFKNSTKLTRVRFPGTIETVAGGIFEKFPNVITECYTSSLYYVGGAGGSVNVLGDNPECAKYVEICSSETKGVMEYVYLKDGEEGKEGTYSEGASFAIEEGEAVLTLNNYDGGMIVSRTGNLTIRLAEGSFNSITAADKHNGILVGDNLTIEGNGILSMEAGDRGDGAGMKIMYGDLTVQDRVNLFVKSGSVDAPTWGIRVEAGDIKIVNSKVEVQIEQTGVNGMAMVAATDMYSAESYGTKGEILLEQCELVEGGKVAAWYADYDGDGHDEFTVARTIAPGELTSDPEVGIMGCAEYVRIEPKAE